MPNHPIANGFVPRQINNGWLNKIQFNDEMRCVTPLVWSGKKYQGSRAGLTQDVVSWAYERPHGGRSFAFTGLDAHSAWSLLGVRTLLVNGILWSAGMDIPPNGSICEIAEEKLVAMQTPRTPTVRDKR